MLPGEACRYLDGGQCACFLTGLQPWLVSLIVVHTFWLVTLMRRFHLPGRCVLPDGALKRCKTAVNNVQTDELGFFLKGSSTCLVISFSFFGSE